ncbi:unnamed protein product [marine sediment metagenome]|uniref:Uncharacterized protein n=1 Tax=marine sediment metagenome TaxID=412755 RepID=X1N937_9ZZZZ
MSKKLLISVLMLSVLVIGSVSAIPYEGKPFVTSGNQMSEGEVGNFGVSLGVSIPITATIIDDYVKPSSGKTLISSEPITETPVLIPISPTPIVIYPFY